MRLQIRIIIAGMLLALVAVFGIATTASADTNSDSNQLTFTPGGPGMFNGINFDGAVWYGVDYNNACRSQHPNEGYLQAGSINTADAASLQCWTPASATSDTSQSLTIGSDNTFTIAVNDSVQYRTVGGLDIQGWCSGTHPGSYAVDVFGIANTWYCLTPN